jgi:hypothetical protein
MSTQSNREVHPACDVDIFNALQSKSDLLHSRPQQLSDLPIVLAESNTLDDAIIVQGTKEKKRMFLMHMKNVLVKIFTTQ